MVGLVNKQQDNKKKFAVIFLVVLIVLGTLTIVLILNMNKGGSKTITKIKAETKTYEKVVRIPSQVIASITPETPETASPTSTLFTALNEDQNVDQNVDQNEEQFVAASPTPLQTYQSSTEKTLPEAGSFLPGTMIFLASLGLIFIAFAL